jgi:hypothetical protein
MSRKSLTVGMTVYLNKSYVNGRGFTHYDSLYNMTGKSKLMVTFMTS